MRHPDAVELLNAEVRAYVALINLQGKVIPKLYGFYNVWGNLRLIPLQPVGEPISEDETIDQQLRKKMRKALRHIHKAGYVQVVTLVGQEEATFTWWTWRLGDVLRTELSFEMDMVLDRYIVHYVIVRG